MEEPYKQQNHKDSRKQTTILRKLQTIHDDKCFLLVVPKDLVSQLKIAKGDYIKYSVNDSNQLILERANV